MIDLILLLQADVDIQAAFDRYENYQSGRGEVFMRQLDVALTLLRRHPELLSWGHILQLDSAEEPHRTKIDFENDHQNSLT